MLAGVLFEAGYFMGERLYKGKPSNPKGFFESREINDINEEILAPYNKRPSSPIIRRLFPRFVKARPRKNQRWLSSISPRRSIKCESKDVMERIRAVTAREPFCYKDPRLSYTLPVWRTVIKPTTVFICVFRRPDVTVRSILAECASREYLSDLIMSEGRAYNLWLNMYSHILAKNQEVAESFLYVHYDQMLDHSAIPQLSAFLEAPLSPGPVDRALNRTRPGGKVPPDVMKLYQRLCAYAGYVPLTSKW
jgi:hypothetical protein